MTARLLSAVRSRRRIAVSSALMSVLLCQTSLLSADEPYFVQFNSCRQGEGANGSKEKEKEEEPPRLSYGPNDCKPRGTLFQWSYGTSFSGGPDLDEHIVTDRPDFTEASVTVGRGVLQIESGYTYISDNDGTTRTTSHSYPETLFRYGIFADWLELRVAQNYAGEDDGLLQNSGAKDLYLGIKIALTPQEGWLPEMAIVPQMTVPTGHDAFTGDRVLPGLNWLYGWDINDFLSMGASTQFNSAVDEDSRNVYTQWAQSWTIGYSLSEKLGAYTEWFAFFPHGADTALPECYFDGGFTYLFTDNIQLDVRAGVGLNEAADDFFAGPGLSIRFK